MIKSFTYFLIAYSLMFSDLLGQTINRYGTTTANFLEIGIGSRATSMGDAYVAVANDVSSIYWNPAGLSNVPNSSALFMVQPWLVDVDMLFAGGAVVVPKIGVFGLGITHLDYGQMDVTNLEYQNGTGERFGASDMAATFTFSRKIVSWFSFGSSMKYISSKIWHSSANAFAVDLGVLVNTKFFSFTGNDKDGLNIGMSISNYGTRMQYDGIDSYQPIDISEFEDGNYGDVAGQFRTSQWELPLIFRIGFALKPIVSNTVNLTVSADALHPNNNAESLNIGAALDYKIPSFGQVSLTSGAKNGMRSINSDGDNFSITFGFGVKMFHLGNKSLSIDYSYKPMGILGNVQIYTVGVSF
ncbi:MAG: PorV/PorQ family protein [Candidatus Neomarinimicrobiota bacterium]